MWKIYWIGCVWFAFGLVVCFWDSFWLFLKNMVTPYDDPVPWDDDMFTEEMLDKRIQRWSE